jgi:acetoin utilization deacetylase AcuC-like enzyme
LTYFLSSYKLLYIGDSVLTGKNRNAFCIVRPPGHHAGVNGLLEGGESCGFCIFNNVAAGAMYALAEHKDVCQRVAIVDIDVHHGNGTEEIVRKCNDPSTLFFFSIHLFDNDEVTAQQSKKKNHQIYKFYPGTGSSDDLAMNIINVPIMPLWKDLSHIQAKASEPKTHNTRKKLRSNTSMALSENTNDDSSEPSTPRINSAATSSSRNSDGESSTATTVQQQQQLHQHSSTSTMVPMTTAIAGTILTLPGRIAYRQAIQSRLLPSLRAFNPNLILISAGFDASSGDVGNARHEKDRERMGIDLLPEDYAWTTRQILHIANICCNGRVVSILEGGYGRTPLSETATTSSEIIATTTVKEQAATTLDRHIFGECAIRHLHAMIDPYDVEQRFG